MDRQTANCGQTVAVTPHDVPEGYMPSFANPYDRH